MNGHDPAEPSEDSEIFTRFAGYTPEEWRLDDVKYKTLFKKYLLKKMTERVPDSDSLSIRMDLLPWAKDFIQDKFDGIGSGSVVGRKATDAYKSNSQKMTTQLADLINCFFFTWLRNRFLTRIVYPDEKNYLTSPFDFEETREFTEGLDEEDALWVEQDSTTKWREEYIKCYESVLSSETWRRLGKRLGTFCRHVGCNATNDAVEALSALRDYNMAMLRDTTAYKLQVELQSKVDEIQQLKEQLGFYQKAIACLSYRNLVETLPFPEYRYGYPKPISATAHWKDFLVAAKDQAGRSGDENHPLYGVLDNKEVLSDGGDIYGTLSKNIHGFSRIAEEYNKQGQKPKASNESQVTEFTFNPNHFTPFEARFLRIVAPDNRLDNGGVDVDKERDRWGVVWEPNKDNGKRKGGFMASHDPTRPSLKNGQQKSDEQREKENRPSSVAGSSVSGISVATSRTLTLTSSQPGINSSVSSSANKKPPAGKKTCTFSGCKRPMGHTEDKCWHKHPELKRKK